MQTPLKVGRAGPKEKYGSCAKERLFQLNGTQKIFILITYLVPNSHHKGSEAVYTNIYNRIFKNNNNNTIRIELFPSAGRKAWSVSSYPGNNCAVRVIIVPILQL